MKLEQLRLKTVLDAVAHGGNPQDLNGAFSVMARDCSPSRVAPLHRFSDASIPQSQSDPKPI
ncbi:hypothetical protein BJP36_40975 [Moorena producens JHB]|uniref:Uncharacterized protein n=1 Tax=Moorena producens (strain JHB) TaxID=1454205 RepID=A0A9Q9SSD4_MOOP1|nr:hypothetical protein [Moorena producens]WAN68741.1 hypothetical protein BJP36_40975 [Moorena producens JHB]